MMNLRLRNVLFYLALALASTSMTAQTNVEVPEPHEDPNARREFFFNLRAYPFGWVPQGARLEALEYSQAKMSRHGAGKNSPLAQKAWRQRGPYDLGGRIHNIAVHPTDGKTVWAAAANGGVWKSTNRGDSWAPVMDFMNSISTGGLAVDPQNPQVVYVGTGEPISANGDTYNGAGIMKSVDGGITWEPLGLTNVGSVSAIVVHPTNSNILIAAGLRNNSGLYRSEDGGLTWTRTSDIAISDISMNPLNPDELIMGTLTRGVLRSTNGGKTVAEANTGIAFGSTKGRATVSYAHSDPSIAYAALEETVGTSTEIARIYKSTNRGASWSKIYDSQVNGLNYFSNSVQTQGYYDNIMAVHPTNPNIVLVGGVFMMRTTNGGESWSPTGSGVHADHHAMAFDPSNPSIFYNGNDGGMYRSEDAGATFRKISKGLAITQFYAMAVDPKQDSLAYGGTQDNGTVTSMSTTSGAVMGGDGFYIVVDHSNSNIIYAENPYGTNITMFINGTPYNAMRGITVNPNVPDAAWSAPLVMDPTNSEVMYNGRRRVYKTFNAGAPGIEWLEASPEVRGFISAIGVSAANPEVVYAGSDRGTVMVSTNGGEEWQDISYGHGLPNRAVMDFAASRKEPGTAYIAYAGFYTSHIFKTTDYGQTWSDVGNGLPDIPINALALHPDNENIVYAGSDIGMFISIDGGGSWATYNNGLPRTEVRDLEVNKKAGTLWLATHGRSMWEIELESEIEIVPTVTAPTGGEVWTGGTAHVIAWNGFSGSVRIDYSLDGGASWNLLKNSVAGKAFRWIVFDTTSIQARLRVTSVADPGKTAVSNTFTIDRFKLGTVLGATGVPGIPYGITFDGEYLWATNFEGNTLLKIDATTLSTVDEVELNIPGGDSLFTDITYYPPRNTFFIHKVRTTLEDDPGGFLFEVTKEGDQVGAWVSPFAYPIGLAWLGSRNPENPYIFMTDRNGNQRMWLVDPESIGTGGTLQPLVEFNRTEQVRYGPRGATAGLDGESIWQVVTDFTGDVLNSAKAYKFSIDATQQKSCDIGLTATAASGYINARGIELDPRDSNLWVSDYAGSIYKISSCDYILSIPPPDQVLAVPGDAAVRGITLGQNRPNPFTSSTEIVFTLRDGAQGKLAVYDMIGRQVALLGEGKFEAGSHTFRFEPHGLPSGVYRYSLILEENIALSRTMVLVR